ncbi:hypothetical protein SEA_MURP_36 [Gordonia phage Murp]|nr:hypothetical protein SEA_MURP_36 [Gordonia phage Murp]
MTPRVRVLRIRPPYSADCPHCLDLLRAEADRPDWRDWFPMGGRLRTTDVDSSHG